MQVNKLKFRILSLAMCSALLIPNTYVDAAGLTQAASADEVNYGTVSSTNIVLLRSIFDAEYYLSQNPDLMDIIGNDYEKLFEHFIKFGVFEGRLCNANFDPSAYASAYSDLKEVFGTDIIKYYEHYILMGTAENRTLTNMESCANAGIIVHPITNEKVQITPQIYRTAIRIGITDVNSLSYLASALSKAQSSGGSVVIAEENESISSELLAAQGLEKIGTITIGDSKDAYGSERKTVGVYIVKGKTGYAGYFEHETETTEDGITYYDFNRENTPENEPDYKTTDYTAPDGGWLTPFARVEYFIQPLYVPYHNVSNRYEHIDEADENYVIKGELPQPNDEMPPTGGVETKMFGSTWSGECTVEENNATNEITCDGIKTDDGSVRDFVDIDEKNEVLKNSIYVGTSTTDNNYSDTLYYDAHGSRDTVYDISMSISEEDDGVHITTGISNEEDNYGHVEEFVVTSD